MTTKLKIFSTTEKIRMQVNEFKAWLEGFTDG
ncbi:hypothetical protein LCGC14_2059610, partial [marine sediment metagenome]